MADSRLADKEKARAMLRRIGRRIAEERWSQRRSVRALAHAVNIDCDALQQLERGEFDIDVLTLVGLCDALRINAGELLLNTVPEARTARGNMTQILVLEQRPARIAAFRTVLEPDYNLTFVDSVKKAIEMGKQGGFVLFLSALHLDSASDESVFDFLRAMKADPQTKAVPFFFCCIRPSHFTETTADALETTARMLGAEYFELIEEGGAPRMYLHIKNAVDTGKKARQKLGT